MKITLEWLKERNACKEGVEYVIEKGLIGLSDVEFVEKLIKKGKLFWAEWLLLRVCSKRQAVSYAIFAAEQVLDLFENEYPGDGRPRAAIEAARKWLDGDMSSYAASASAARASAARAAAADAAAYAAYAAARAYAADTYAAYAARAASAAEAVYSAAARAADGVTRRRFNAAAWQPDRDDDANVAAITQVAGRTGEGCAGAGTGVSGTAAPGSPGGRRFAPAAAGYYGLRNPAGSIATSRGPREWPGRRPFGGPERRDATLPLIGLPMCLRATNDSHPLTQEGGAHGFPDSHGERRLAAAAAVRQGFDRGRCAVRA